MTITRKKLMRPATVLAMLLLAVPGLAACGDDEDSAEHGGETHTAANGAEYNDADVTFASNMSQDHANAHGEGMEPDTDMPGMMSEDEMAELEAARDEEFQTSWLEMMIEHHEGAIVMAQTEIEDGKFPDAVKMAESIESSQAAEVEQMQGLLGS
jgi:uncharacterized protein (DUF305 family)